MNNQYLTSGEEYPLAKIFSGGIKIVIPDLQRDYCWGDHAYDKDGNAHELVTRFVSSLIDLFNNDQESDFTLGLLYGYEQPSSHIQLCDGQQRMTTLYLLLGVLNRKTNGRFQKYLISNFGEVGEENEPTLQYAIRESTLYFIGDLVREFFLKEDFKIEDIKKADWYFDEYNLDASIISIIEALTRIEKRLDEEANLDLVSFGNFVTDRLHFLYYDMGNRRQGEETFVVINTTGEPLTPTENLKPIFVNNHKTDEQEKASELWEEWETYFWNHRNKNDTADKGFLEFIRWVLLLRTEDKITFENLTKGGLVNINGLRYQEIQLYFEDVKFAFNGINVFPNDNNWLAPENMNSQIDWFKILPVIAYIRRFGQDNKRNIIRVRQFFENMSRSGNVGRDIATMLPLAVRIIKRLPTDDIASITEMENISKNLLSEEERLKFTIYKEVENREQLEDAFWKEEAHKVWEGEIMPILEWSGINSKTMDTQGFEFDDFKEYSRIFSIIFEGEKDYDKLDVTRRALLTRDLKEYPRIFKGNTNFSFCWEFSDWKTLINDNIEKFKEFFEKLLYKSRDDIYAEQERMIRGNPNEKDFDEFVQIRGLLEFCKKKNIQWDYEEECWILIDGTYISGPHANIKTYRLYIDLEKNEFWDNEKWELWFWEYADTRCVIEDKVRNIVIDVIFSKTSDIIDSFVIQLFKREIGNNEGKKGKEALRSVANDYDLIWQEDPSDDYYRYESKPIKREEIIQKIRQLLDSLDNEGN